MARAIRGRNRFGDPKYGITDLPVRHLERPSPAQFGKVMGTLAGNRYRQEIAAARIGKDTTSLRLLRLVCPA